ncbi:MAG: hypothetical protein IT333_01275 [Thermomicrobiales bacterium]|jgi:hypothetical protein|nr:hypothetical protein [Thermomicrobiales bacterium]
MSPSIILSLTIAVALGSTFHAILGRRLWQWPVYLFSAIAGFFLGYVGGVALNIELIPLGSIPLAASLAGAFLLLGLAWYFMAPSAAS